jgi:hypothetical protein
MTSSTLRAVAKSALLQFGGAFTAPPSGGDRLRAIMTLTSSAGISQTARGFLQPWGLREYSEMLPCIPQKTGVVLSR